jgi:hypothetical protein
MRHLVLILLLLTSLARAESTRIEVYPLSQNYWDIKTGDTLGEIVNTLIPGNPYLQEKLMQDLVSTNPQVFPGGNPNHMLANKRLWLPNAVKQPDDSTTSSGYTIETYQWGSIKKMDEGRGTRNED